MGCRAGRRGRSSCTGTAKALSAEQAEKLVKAAADELPDGGGALAARALCMRTWSCC